MTQNFKFPDYKLSSMLILCTWISLSFLVQAIHGKSSLEFQYSQQEKSFSRFLSELMTSEFSSCDLFYVFDTLSTSTKENVEAKEIFETLITNYENLMSNSQSEPTRSKDNPLAFYLSAINNTENYSGLRLVRKRGGQCALLFVSVYNQYYKDALSKFSQLFTKPFDAVTRKDEDFYIFITRSELAESILLNEISREIKFKFAVYEKDQQKSNSKINSANLQVEFEMRTVCFYCSNGEPAVVKLSPGESYTRSAGTEYKWQRNPISVPTLFPDFSKNGHGHVLQISSAVRVIFLVEIEENPEKGGEWRFKRGMYKSLLEEITKTFNYTYKVWPSSFGGGTGTILKNGTWVGGVRDIIDKKADIGIATSPNYSRYKLGDFSHTICYAWVNFVVGPPKLTYSWKAVYQPFSSELWTGTALSFLGIILICRVIEKFHNFVMNRGNETAVINVSRKQDKFNEHLWTWNISVLLEQDVDYPKMIVQRLAFGIWLFCSLILTTAYRTKLVEFMAFPNYIPQPKTFPALLNSQSKGFTWGFESSAVGSSAHNHFKSSKSPIYSEMYKHMTTENDSFTCYNKAVQQNFGCISWAGTSEFALYKNFSDKYGRNPLKMSEDLTLFVSSGYVMQKRALFRTTFDRLIDSTREMAMNERWKILDYEKLLADRLDWEKREGISSGGEDALPEGALILANLQGPFYLLFAGSLVSLFVWITELCKKKVGKKQNNWKIAALKFTASVGIRILKFLTKQLEEQNIPQY